MPTRFSVGAGLQEADRLVLTRVARVFGVSVSDFITWAVDQAIDPGIAEIVMARTYQPPPLSKIEPKPPCKADGCGAEQHARGFCGRHYERAYRTNEWAA